MSKTVNDFQNLLEATLIKELSPDIAIGFIGLIVIADGDDIVFRVSTTFNQTQTEELLELGTKSLIIPVKKTGSSIN
jgi:hypothetical protein